MATIREVVIKHHKKSDGTFNVKYRLTHRGKQVYISSPHYIIEKQLKKDLTIKDNFILTEVSLDLASYRKKLSEVGSMVDLYTAEELAKLLKNKGETPSVEFVQFSKAYIAELKKDNRKGSAANLQTVVNSLCDYFKSSVIPIENINSLMLPKYEAFLRGERKITRLNQFKQGSYRNA